MAFCDWAHQERLIDAETLLAVRDVRAPEIEHRESEDPDASAGNMEAAVWYLRAWHDAEQIAPLDVGLPVAQIDNKIAASVRDGFARLVGLRWLSYPGQPLAFTRTFAPAWCEGSFTEGQAAHAIRALADVGVIRDSGERFAAGGWTGTLWLPGDAR